MHNYYTDDRQAFPWHPFGFVRRQTTRRQMSLPLEPLTVDQGTDYTKTDKSSPGVPLRAPEDRLNIEDKPSTGTLLRVHQRTDYIYKSSLEPLSEYPRGQTTKI